MSIEGWNILITGGTGLVGRHLIPMLKRGGAKVQVLTRNPDRYRNNPNLDNEYLGWDGVSTKGWGQQVDKTDAVINLVGESLNRWPWSAGQLKKIHDSRTMAGHALVEAIQAASKKPKVLIQASAIGYYGNTEDRIVDEAAPPGSDILAKIVLDWENSTSAVEDMQIRRPIIRTALVLDTHEGVLPIMALPFRLFVGGPIGSGMQWVSWIHIKDLIQAILFLLEDETMNGPFVLSSPNPVRNAQFGKSLAKSLERPYWFPTPGFLLRLVLGKMASLVLEGQRSRPTHLLLHDFSFQYPDIQSALDDLYHTPTSI